MTTTPASAQQVRVPVQGMTCRACEVRVGKALRKVPGVLEADVSARAGLARLVVDPAVPSDRLDADVAAAVSKAGYAVGREPWFSADVSVWRTAAVAVLVVAAAAVLLVFVGLPDVVGSASPATGGLLVVLLVGLAAGVSTCMALVGGLVLAVSSAYASTVSYADGAVRRASWRPHVWFHVGRIVGFLLLGALLGLLGSRVTLPERAQAVVTLGVALVMAVVALRLLRVSPRLSAWTPTLPPALGRALGLDERAGRPYSDARTAVLGALTFFLPCGFTQAMQVYAITTGSPVTAGVVMAVFAIGTTPGLLALAGLPALAGGRARDQVLAFTGATVLAFAVVNATGALTLLGLTPRGTSAPVAMTPNVTVSGATQTVTMTQTTRGYSPDISVVKPGVPITWQIESVTDMSCAAYLRGVTDPSFSVNLKTGPNTLAVPALASGQRWDFTCTMGMYSGAFIALDR